MPARPMLRILLGQLPEALAEWECAAASEPPWYVSPNGGTADAPLLTVRKLAGTLFRMFRYGDGSGLLSTGPVPKLAAWVPPLTLADAATYLLGPVLGFVLGCAARFACTPARL